MYKVPKLSFKAFIYFKVGVLHEINMRHNTYNPAYTGDPQADRWELDVHLTEVAQRWRIEPARDLAQQVPA